MNAFGSVRLALVILAIKHRHGGPRPCCGTAEVQGVRLLVVATVWFCVIAPAQAGGDPGVAAMIIGTAGSNIDFVPGSARSAANVEKQANSETDSELELRRMIDGGFQKIDLALANWLLVAEIPEFQSMSRESYFKQLERSAERVKGAMASRERSGDRGNRMTRCGSFVDAVHELGFAYAEEFRKEDLAPAQMRSLYADPDNVFLAGLLRKHRGSCVSMPLIYLVIGQRLGLPVHLVSIGKHYFIRWEEPGLRMNIETTINERACFTPDDSVYLESEGMRASDVKGSQLRNLTDREVLGELLFTRAGYWAMKGEEGKGRASRDLAFARQLCPDDPAVQAMCDVVFQNTVKTVTNSGVNDLKGNSK